MIPLTQQNLATSQLPPQPSKLSTSLPASKAESTPLSPASKSATTAMQGRERAGTWLTPSLAAVMHAYEQDGAGDTELFKALLSAKAKEDERLAALDNLRAEQLRAANTLALHQQASWAAQAYGYPPFSPTSPPSSSSTQLSPYPWKDAPSYSHSGTFSHPAPTQFGPRPLPSSSASPPMQHPSHDDRKRKPVVDVGSPAQKVRKSKAATHEEAMLALRARCERNQAAAALQFSSAHHPRPIARAPPRAKFASPPPSKAYPSPPPQFRPLAQAATSDLRSTSSSPPLDYLGRFPAKDEGEVVEQVRTSSIRMLLNGDGKSTFARNQTSDCRSE